MRDVGLIIDYEVVDPLQQNAVAEHGEMVRLSSAGDVEGARKQYEAASQAVDRAYDSPSLELHSSRLDRDMSMVAIRGVLNERGSDFGEAADFHEQASEVMDALVATLSNQLEPRSLSYLASEHVATDAMEGRLEVARSTAHEAGSKEEGGHLFLARIALGKTRHRYDAIGRDKNRYYGVSLALAGARSETIQPVVDGGRAKNAWISKAFTEAAASTLYDRRNIKPIHLAIGRRLLDLRDEDTARQSVYDRP